MISHGAHSGTCTVDAEPSLLIVLESSYAVRFPVRTPLPTLLAGKASWGTSALWFWTGSLRSLVAVLLRRALPARRGTGAVGILPWCALLRMRGMIRARLPGGSVVGAACVST